MTYIESKRLKIIWCFSLGLILQGIPVNAGFRPLIKPHLPENNISACKKEIQKAIYALKNNTPENFEFECTKGVVSMLCVSTASAIATNWKLFVTQNSILFGVKKDEIKSHGNDPFSFQTWRGINVFNTGCGMSYGSKGDEKISCIKPHTIDTTLWDIDVTPSISSSTAARMALTLWKKEDSLQPIEVQDAILFVAQTTSTPRLIWYVPGIKHLLDPEYRYGIHCIIDAHTGVIPKPKDCTAIPNAQESQDIK